MLTGVDTVNRKAYTLFMVKTFTKSEIKTLNTIASDTMGSTCACCQVAYKIWYVGTVEIARTYCKCESAPVGANRFGVLSADAQMAA